MRQLSYMIQSETELDDVKAILKTYVAEAVEHI